MVMQGWWFWALRSEAAVCRVQTRTASVALGPGACCLAPQVARVARLRSCPDVESVEGVHEEYSCRHRVVATVCDGG